jgi:hypothetical protein
VLQKTSCQRSVVRDQWSEIRAIWQTPAAPIPSENSNNFLGLSSLRECLARTGFRLPLGVRAAAHNQPS